MAGTAATAFDIPAVQGDWDVVHSHHPLKSFSQVLAHFHSQIGWNGITRHDLISMISDKDSEAYVTIVNNGQVTEHYKDFNLTDGREVFKYGTNPSDNDTDGDMIPDWYEYAKAWNEIQR